MPPEDALAPLFAAQGLLAGGKPLDAPRLHITMYLLDPLVPDMGASLARLATVMAQLHLPAARIKFDRLSGQGGSGLLLSGDRLDDVERLRETLLRAMESADVRQFPAYRFNPHMTLRRGKVETMQRAIDPIGWDAREIVLVRSLVGQSRYERLEQWPLMQKDII